LEIFRARGKTRRGAWGSGGEEEGAEGTKERINEQKRCTHLISGVICRPPTGSPHQSILNIYNSRRVVVTSLPLELAGFVTMLVYTHWIVAITRPVVTGLKGSIIWLPLTILVSIVRHYNDIFTINNTKGQIWVKYG